MGTRTEEGHRDELSNCGRPVHIRLLLIAEVAGESVLLPGESFEFVQRIVTSRFQHD
jgi:hypothetical protein